MRTTHKTRIFLIGIITFILAVFINMAFINKPQDDKKKPWDVPEASKKVQYPVKSDTQSLATGKASYEKNCKSCHGVKGLGDGPKAEGLETPICDFSVEEFQTKPDGEIFYKVKEGRGDMPSFKKKITDDNEIWAVVNYMRTFKKK